MKYITRWGLMRNTQEENDATHSLEVAMLAHALGVIGNTYFGKEIDVNELAVLGLYHDATEIVTGDMPTPIKYFAPELREAYKKVEDTAADHMISGLPKELHEIYRPLLKVQGTKPEYSRYVKAADKLSAYLKCVEEERFGNDDFQVAKETIYKSIQEFGLEELDYFMEHFLPAYELTLDEQTKREE